MDMGEKQAVGEEPQTPAAATAAAAEAKDVCEGCGKPLSQERLEELLTAPADAKWVCGDCLKTAAAVSETPPAPETASAETEKSSAPVTLEQLDAALDAFALLITRAKNAGASGVAKALTEVFNGILAVLDDRAKALEPLEPLLAVIKEAEDRLLPRIINTEERARQTEAERAKQAEIDKSFAAKSALAAKHRAAAMKTGGSYVSLHDLQAVAKANGNGNGNGNVVGSIKLPPPPPRKPITADIPCGTDGCKNVVPGIVVARWQGNPKGPKGGWRCPSCYTASRKAAEKK